MTGANGIFDVHLDGELVFEKSMLGRYPDPDDVLPLLRDELEQRVSLAYAKRSRRGSVVTSRLIARVVRGEPNSARR